MMKNIKQILVFIMIFALICWFFCVLAKITTYAAEEDNDTYLSEEIQASCREYGSVYGICPEVLEALIETESSGKQSARSDYGNGDGRYAYGICQISNIHGTHFTTEDLQIDKACQMLIEFLEDIPDMAYALDRFNGNSKALDNYEAGIISDYASTILERAEELERIHGK